MLSEIQVLPLSILSEWMAIFNNLAYNAQKLLSITLWLSDW